MGSLRSTRKLDAGPLSVKRAAQSPGSTPRCFGFVGNAWETRSTRAADEGRSDRLHHDTRCGGAAPCSAAEGGRDPEAFVGGSRRNLSSLSTVQVDKLAADQGPTVAEFALEVK